MPGGDPVRLVEVPHLGVRASAVPRRGVADRHWLVVSSVPESMYGEAALQRGLQRLEWVGPRALAHEAVVEHFLAAAAVLPMQLFALFKVDARAVDHVVGDRRRIAQILSRIERHVEWGLRLTWDPSVARKAVDRRKPLRGDTRRTLTGAAYLARKRDLRDVTHAQLQRARADAGRLYRAIARGASKARRRTDIERAAPGSRVLLDAAFLVPAQRASAFRAAVRRHTRALKRSGVAVSVTGPWPAYHFV